MNTYPVTGWDNELWQVVGSTMWRRRGWGCSAVKINKPIGVFSWQRDKQLQIQTVTRVKSADSFSQCELPLELLLLLLATVAGYHSLSTRKQTNITGQRDTSELHRFQLLKVSKCGFCVQTRTVYVMYSLWAIFCFSPFQFTWLHSLYLDISITHGMYIYIYISIVSLFYSFFVSWLFRG